MLKITLSPSSRTQDSHFDCPSAQVCLQASSRESLSMSRMLHSRFHIARHLAAALNGMILRLGPGSLTLFMQ